jgi:enamine deaminase RidA (YjgF/YER057c/UK114 family)
MAIERIQPEGLSKPAAYSHVVRAGNTVYVAGQTATDASGNLVGLGDIEAQAAQVYGNIRKALASVGADFSNLVKVNTYLTREEDIEGYRRARATHLNKDLPASTLVVISRLANPDFLIEIEAVAVLE